MSEAYVICLNDFPEHVVLGPLTAAEAKLDELSRADWIRDPYGSFGGGWMDYPTYRKSRFWHIRTVPLFVPTPGYINIPT